MVQVDDLVEPRAEKVLLARLPALFRPHRKSPPPRPQAKESQTSIRRNPARALCKKTAGQSPKTGKSPYAKTADQPLGRGHSDFFTDD
jgi:hypothetical protein